jgi:hypothetical protein
VEWQIKDKLFSIDIDIPEGGFADVYLPFSGYAETVDDGHYHFEEEIK